MKHSKTIKVLSKYLKGETSLEENAKVDKWYDSIDDTNLPEELNEELFQIGEQLYQRIRSKMIPVVPLYKKPLFKAAAVISFFLFIGGATLLTMNKASQKTQVASVVSTIPKINAPAENIAYVTLSNGRKVKLGGAETGVLASQKNSKLVKLSNGQIKYENINQKSIEVLAYNTLTNPKGSKVICLALTDGSKVWLNAGSSLTYPVAFVGTERKVTINGEAYFEIAHDANKPFKVKKGDMEVTVLGTHFNVNAYDEDAEIKVTLLQGSVKVSSGNDTKLLKPAQQAQINGAIKVNTEVNMNEVMAWKNGYFYFDNTDVHTVMRLIDRWYGIDVEFQGIPSEKKFEGEMERNLSLPQVLKILENNGLHFKQEGEKLIVLP
ncbi:FecR family protein [Solitalea koreensis]|uniref:FecR family protein n=1 Tax=Solitalea koreensis TaxID=543615 RepID=A0A521CAG1_9SPHI|nr:FecR family protein [Solitalea koreensis]SMO56467.1 FecR family protein [Solitalea koreensis]